MSSNEVTSPYEDYEDHLITIVVMRINKQMLLNKLIRSVTAKEYISVEYMQHAEKFLNGQLEDYLDILQDEMKLQRRCKLPVDLKEGVSRMETATDLVSHAISSLRVRAKFSETLDQPSQNAAFHRDYRSLNDNFKNCRMPIDEVSTPVQSSSHAVPSRYPDNQQLINDRHLLDQSLDNNEFLPRTKPLQTTFREKTSNDPTQRITVLDTRLPHHYQHLPHKSPAHYDSYPQVEPTSGHNVSTAPAPRHQSHVDVHNRAPSYNNTAQLNEPRQDAAFHCVPRPLNADDCSMPSEEVFPPIQPSSHVVFGRHSEHRQFNNDEPEWDHSSENDEFITRKKPVLTPFHKSDYHNHRVNQFDLSPSHNHRHPSYCSQTQYGRYQHNNVQPTDYIVLAQPAPNEQPHLNVGLHNRLPSGKHSATPLEPLKTPPEASFHKNHEDVKCCDVDSTVREMWRSEEPTSNESIMTHNESKASKYVKASFTATSENPQIITPWREVFPPALSNDLAYAEKRPFPVNKRLVIHPARRKEYEKPMNNSLTSDYIQLVPRGKIKKNTKLLRQYSVLEPRFRLVSTDRPYSIINSFIPTRTRSSRITYFIARNVTPSGFNALTDF